MDRQSIITILNESLDTTNKDDKIVEALGLLKGEDQDQCGVCGKILGPDDEIVQDVEAGPCCANHYDESTVVCICCGNDTPPERIHKRGPVACLCEDCKDKAVPTMSVNFDGSTIYCFTWAEVENVLGSIKDMADMESEAELAASMIPAADLVQVGEWQG